MKETEKKEEIEIEKERKREREGGERESIVFVFCELTFQHFHASRRKSIQQYALIRHLLTYIILHH